MNHSDDIIYAHINTNNARRIPFAESIMPTASNSHKHNVAYIETCIWQCLKFVFISFLINDWAITLGLNNAFHSKLTKLISYARKLILTDFTDAKLEFNPFSGSYIREDVLPHVRAQWGDGGVGYVLRETVLHIWWPRIRPAGRSAGYINYYIIKYFIDY